MFPPSPIHSVFVICFFVKNCIFEMLTPRSVLRSSAGVHRLLQAYSPACRLHLSSKPGAKPLAVSFLWLTFFSYVTFTSAGEPLIGEQVRGGGGGQLLH